MGGSHCGKAIGNALCSSSFLVVCVRTRRSSWKLRVSVCLDHPCRRAHVRVPLCSLKQLTLPRRLCCGPAATSSASLVSPYLLLLCLHGGCWPCVYHPAPPLNPYLLWWCQLTFPTLYRTQSQQARKSWVVGICASL